MKGRKPVPTVLKIARGNPGQHAIADDEPQPSTEIDLAVPKLLRGDRIAKAAWQELAPMLHRLGLLTECDRDALILLRDVCALATGRAAPADRGRDPDLEAQQRYPSPYLHIAKDALTQCHKLLLEFGLTPVSRTRAHVGKKAPADSQKDRFFGVARASRQPA